MVLEIFGKKEITVAIFFGVGCTAHCAIIYHDGDLGNFLKWLKIVAAASNRFVVFIANCPRHDRAEDLKTI